MNLRNFLGTISQFSQTHMTFIISGIITHEFEGTRVAVLLGIRRTTSPFLTEL